MTRPPSADAQTYVPERRTRVIERLPSGALLDASAFRDWLASWALDRPKQVVVRRLSDSMPELREPGR